MGISVNSPQLSPRPSPPCGEEKGYGPDNPQGLLPQASDGAASPEYRRHILFVKCPNPDSAQTKGMRSKHHVLYAAGNILYAVEFLPSLAVMPSNQQIRTWNNHKGRLCYECLMKGRIHDLLLYIVIKYKIKPPALEIPGAGRPY